MRLHLAFLGLASVVAAMAGAAPSAVTFSKPGVTFSKDVAPILQRRCQGCHRPGEAAPFSLLTYEQARPWAKAMRQSVLLKKMPPWFADPHYGRFSNDRSLTQQESNTLVAWVDTGAREGDPNDLPKPAAFLDGWNVGKPDAVFEMPHEFQVPAKGTIEYQYIVLPMNFTEDKWVERAEVRPGNRAILHHVIAFVRSPDSKWHREAQPGVPFVPEKKKGEDNSGGIGGEFLVGYAPGTIPEVLAPGRAKLVKAGSDIVLQMHYTANGKADVDRTKVGLIFSREPVRERVMTIAASDDKFIIPSGASDHRVDAEMELGSDVQLIALLPHMHLRGKDFEYRAVYPGGRSEVLLRVPRYSFSWQLSYYFEKPITLPKGTKIACTAHFDNSANNVNNPDPSKEVRWGDQSWEEMMIGFMDVAFDAKMDVKKLFPEEDKSKPSAD